MNVIFLGDSLVLGVGDPDGLGWVGRLARLAAAGGAALNVYNLGIRANRSTDLLERLPEEAGRRLHAGPPGQEGRIVLSFGAADLASPGGRPKVAPATSAANARLLLRAAAALAPTLWISPPPMALPELDDLLQALCAAYAAIADDMGVPFLNIRAPLAAGPGYLAELRAGDGIHPGAEGYRAIAQVVAQWRPWRDWCDESRS